MTSDAPCMSSPLDPLPSLFPSFGHFLTVLYLSYTVVQTAHSTQGEATLVQSSIFSPKETISNEATQSIVM